MYARRQEGRSAFANSGVRRLSLGGAGAQGQLEGVLCHATSIESLCVSFSDQRGSGLPDRMPFVFPE